jgi:hypothetical protein
MCKDTIDVVLTISSRKVAYYNLPRGKDLLRSNTCCDDENVRAGGNTSLPEQHFYPNKKRKNEETYVAASTI